MCYDVCQMQGDNSHREMRMAKCDAFRVITLGGTVKKKFVKKNCVWHSPIIGDGVGMLKPTSIAHADPVVPAQYFVP